MVTKITPKRSLYSVEYAAVFEVDGKTFCLVRPEGRDYELTVGSTNLELTAISTNGDGDTIGRFTQPSTGEETEFSIPHKLSPNTRQPSVNNIFGRLVSWKSGRTVWANEDRP